MSLVQSKSSEATIGLVIDVTGTASLGPEASWSSASQDTASVIYEDEDYGVVVMICGIYITKKIFVDDVKPENRREKQKILRGGSEDVPKEHIYTIDMVEKGAKIQLSVERFPPKSGRV